MPVAVACAALLIAESGRSQQAAAPAQALAAAPTTQVDTFNGSWVWQDARPQSIARLDINGTTVRGYLECQEELCDIGEATGTVYWNPSAIPDARAIRAAPVSPRFKAVDPRRAQVRNPDAIAARTPSGPVAMVATFQTAFRTLIVIVSAPERAETFRTVEVEIYGEANDAPRAVRDRVTFTERMVLHSGTTLDAIQQLEFPLPRPSSRQVLPEGLVTAGSGETLGAAFDRLEDAIQRAEFIDWSTYAIGDHGFAIVTQAERIGDDGSPLAGQRRWPQELAGIDPADVAHSLRDYLRQLLFGAGEGRYRVILFAVTDLSLDVSPEPPDPSTIDELWFGGDRHLPDALRGAVLGADGRCEVLVYEFARAAAEDLPTLVVPSSIGAQRHIVGAGLWTVEETRR